MEKPLAKLGRGANLDQYLSPNKQLIAIITASCIDVYDFRQPNESETNKHKFQDLNCKVFT